MNARESRTPGHATELFRRMTPLFPKETLPERRIREAAASSRISAGDAIPMTAPWALSAGAAWPMVPQTIMNALMATAVYYRYAGDGDFPEETGAGGLLGAEGAVVANRSVSPSGSALAYRVRSKANCRI
jgi:hypothetical protein